MFNTNADRDRLGNDLILLGDQGVIGISGAVTKSQYSGRANEFSLRRGSAQRSIRQLGNILEAGSVMQLSAQLFNASEYARNNAGKAFNVFLNMVKAQGGNTELVLQPERMMRASYTRTVLAPQSGYISKVNAEQYGLAALRLGAGRNTMKDIIDYSAGIYLLKKTGDFLDQGDAIAILYTNKEDSLSQAEELLLNATEWSDVKPTTTPLVIKRID